MISASKRLQKEWFDYSKNKTHEQEILLIANPSNILQWEATVQAPNESYYKGFKFDLAIQAPSDYPMRPPTIRFKTKIFHPNVLFNVTKIRSIITPC
jgi:ubiquitin-protein ligase